MNIERGALGICLLAALLFCSCGRGHKSESVKPIKIVASHQDIESGPWHLLVYGAQSITIDTLEVSPKGKISYNQLFDLDTIDLLLLRNGVGRLQLPLFPDRDAEAYSVKISDKELSLKGLLYEPLLKKWYVEREESEEQLLDFLSAHNKELPTLLLVADGMKQYQSGEKQQNWQNLFAQLARDQYDLAGILGWKSAGDNSWNRDPVVPYSFVVSGMKDRVNFKDFVGKNRIVALNIMELSPQDSALFASQKRYLHLLDSLGVPSYSVLLNDSLPKSLKTKSKGTKQYFLIDSIGQSLTFLKEQSIAELPTFMVVDSLQNIERSWNNPDSLINYIKQQKK